MLRSFFLISASVTLSTSLWAQTSVTITAPPVDEKTAMENRTTFVNPVYPPIALLAHVSGTVVLQFEIEPDGTVGPVNIVSGPPMLQGAAVEAVQQWHYKPFLSNGSPSAVSTNVSIPFGSDYDAASNDKAVQKVFFPLADKCRQAVLEDVAPIDQANACLRAAKAADKFASDSRYIEKRSAYTYATTALLRDHEAKEALHFAEKAVKVSESGHDDGAGRVAAYGVRAQARAATGNLIGADQDLTRAENEQRAALDTPAGHDLHANYTHALIDLLRFHAKLLHSMNKEPEAQSKLDEAAELQSQ
jgi:TonB family protein